MSDFYIEAYSSEDLRPISELEKECFERPWSYDSFCMEYADKSKFYFVAKDSVTHELIGYGGYQHILDEGHVMNIAVKDGYRRKGVGTAILARIIGSARTQGIVAVTLEVDDSNQKAISLYEKLGFVNYGLRPHYYGWDKPARIYWLKLQSEN